MNPEQQRIAIAEVCGWFAREDKDGFWRAVDASGNMTHELWMSESNVWSAGIPNYLNDLNAMHEAEMILTKLQRMIYVNILWEKCSIAKADPYDWSVSSKPTLRAEAFLHTIGKWKEAK